jgi:hypothetical protein
MEALKMSRITKKELTEKVEKIVKNLTDMEQKTIKHFALNYNDMMSNISDNANFVSIDYVSEEEHISKKQLRGVFSSLIKKGLIFDGEGAIGGVDDDLFYTDSLGIAVFFYIYDKKEYDIVTDEDIEKYGYGL